MNKTLIKLKPALSLLLGLALACVLALLGSLVADSQPQLAKVLTLSSAGVLSVMLLLAVVDAVWQHSLGMPLIKRHLPAQFVQGQAHEIELHFTPSEGRFWRRPRQLVLADLYPAHWQTDTPLLTIQTLPGRHSQIGYSITPMRRGEAEFKGIEYWLPSVLGLWQRRQYQAITVKVRVLPDFSRILGAELVSMQRWLNWVGVRKVPHLGQGQDFHQLRDYQQGDDIRYIDWKAMSKLNKPIVRSFQQEQDQQVIFLLDCGRNMRLHMGELSHFDHSLQAMLLLSFTALKHGDAVGLLTFAHEQPRWVPPHKGVAQLGRLVQGVYDVEPSLQAGDLESAIGLLLQKQRRRALVVVLTHIHYEDSDAISTQLLRLQRHHLVLLASLRPHTPEEIMARKIGNQPDAATYLGAWQYQQQAAQILQQLHIKKISTLDALPNQLSSKLINRYLNLKRRQAW